MSEALTLDRQQDVLWFEQYRGQFPDALRGQSAAHGQFPPNLARYAAETAQSITPSSEQDSRTVQFGRSLGNTALNGTEYVAQGVGDFAGDFFTALAGAEVPAQRPQTHIGQYALAA